MFFVFCCLKMCLGLYFRIGNSGIIDFSFNSLQNFVVHTTNTHKNNFNHVLFSSNSALNLINDYGFPALEIYHRN